jgi:hypothetical protein
MYLISSHLISPSYSLNFYSLSRKQARTEFVFFFGFRNMAMQFFYTVLYAIDNDFQQLYLPSLRYEDYSGASGTTLIPHIPHELLFDVVYWNSFYPKLPRLVRYHPVFTDLSNTTGRWVDDGKAANATKPYPSPDAAFSRYRQLRQEWYKTGQPHPSDALNFRAFQPCPDMRRLLAKVAPPPDSTTTLKDYCRTRIANRRSRCMHASNRM